MSVECYFNVTNLSKNLYLKLLAKQRKIEEETGETPYLDSLFEDGEKGIDGEDLFIETIDCVYCRDSNHYVEAVDNIFGFKNRRAEYFDESCEWDEDWDYDCFCCISNIQFFLTKEDVKYAINNTVCYLDELKGSNVVDSYDLENSEDFYFETIRFYNALKRLQSLKNKGLNVTIKEFLIY